MLQLWRDTAESEMRMNLLTVLKTKNLGLNEVENFSLGLRYNFKSEKMQDLRDKPLDRVIQSAMAMKMKDEVHHHYELKKRREILKKRLAEKYHPRTHAYKKTIKYLRDEAAEVKKTQSEKYRRKVEQIEKNFRNTEEENLAAPQSMVELSHLRVFTEEKYSMIEVQSIEVPRIGEIELSSEEEAIIKRSPKFAVL